MSVVSDSPVKTYYIKSLQTFLQTYHKYTTSLLQIYYTNYPAYCTHIVSNVSRGGFKKFIFTDNFQINNVPVGHIKGLSTRNVVAFLTSVRGLR